jgi:hypothetical protein
MTRLTELRDNRTDLFSIDVCVHVLYVALSHHLLVLCAIGRHGVIFETVYVVCT